VSGDARFYVLRIVEPNVPEFLTKNAWWASTPGEADTFDIWTAHRLAKQHPTTRHATAARIVEQGIVEGLVVLGSNIETGKVIA
jgi:hypothetical protein